MSFGRLGYFLHDFQGYLLATVLAFIIFLITTILVFRSSRSELWKRVVISCFFTLFLLTLVYSCFEAFIRYRHDESDSLGFLRTNGKWFQRHVVYNADFYRDKNFSTEKKKGVFRIGVLGDSITFGYGIKNPEDRFTNVLEKKFRDAGYDVEVYNLGKSGYDTYNELDESPQLEKFKFDMYIWQYFLNDAEPRQSKGGKILADERGQKDLSRILSSHSYFFDYIYWRLSARYDKTFLALRNADMQQYRDKRNLEQHKKDIEDLRKKLTSGDKKVFVIIFPFISLLPNYPAGDIHVLVNKIFREQGLETIDLLDDLKGKRAQDLVVGRYDYHPDEGVHRLAAERLFQKILPLVKQHAKNYEHN